MLYCKNIQVFYFVLFLTFTYTNSSMYTPEYILCYFLLFLLYAIYTQIHRNRPWYIYPHPLWIPLRSYPNIWKSLSPHICWSTLTRESRIMRHTQAHHTSYQMAHSGCGWICYLTLCCVDHSELWISYHRDSDSRISPYYYNSIRDGTRHIDSGIRDIFEKLPILGVFLWLRYPWWWQLHCSLPSTRHTSYHLGSVFLYRGQFILSRTSDL
jgi:hypothetical protein